MPYDDRMAYRLVCDADDDDNDDDDDDDNNEADDDDDDDRSGLVQSIEGCEAGARHRGEDQHYGGRPLQVITKNKDKDKL